MSLRWDSPTSPRKDTADFPYPAIPTSPLRRSRSVQLVLHRAIPVMRRLAALTLQQLLLGGDGPQAGTNGVGARPGQLGRTAPAMDLDDGLFRRGLLLGQVEILDDGGDHRFDLRR